MGRRRDARRLSTDMTQFDAERLRILITRHARFTGSQARRRDPRRLGEFLPKFRKVMPVEFSRALAEMDKDSSRCRRPSKGGMGKVTGFLEFERNDRDYLPVEERIRNYKRIRAAAAREGHPRAGRALHELRRAVLPRHQHDHRRPTGCPVNNQIPDWNDLVYLRQLGRGRAQPALDQQFPGSHRPRLPGAVRGVLHAQHRRQSGHHQNHRMRDRRPRDRERLDQAGALRRTRPARRSRWSAQVRPAWPARSSSRAPATTCISTRSTPRPAA